MAEAMSIGISVSMISNSFNSIFFPTTTDNPKTSKILVILEPITFPTTISEEPLNTEANDVANSGRDVPNATMVTPIMNGDIPNDNPIFSAL